MFLNAHAPAISDISIDSSIGYFTLVLKEFIWT
ncbi:DUF1506 family protein [Borreliella garinii]